MRLCHTHLPIFTYLYDISAINFKDDLSYSEHLFPNMNILNAYKINLPQIVSFIHKGKSKQMSPIFWFFAKLKKEQKYTSQYFTIISLHRVLPDIATSVCLLKMCHNYYMDVCIVSYLPEKYRFRRKSQIEGQYL